MQPFQINFHQYKKRKMKLSKTILSGLLIGAGFIVVTSCEKEDVRPEKNKTEKEIKRDDEPCPACGLG